MLCRTGQGAKAKPKKNQKVLLRTVMFLVQLAEECWHLVAGGAAGSTQQMTKF